MISSAQEDVVVAPDSARPKLRILVVDDEFDIREMIKLGLSQDGHEVVTAGRGKQAIEIAQCLPIDLLITDLKMPEMNGIEAATRIRDIVQTVPVIVMSGYLTPAAEVECRALGGVTLVRKPFEYETLTAAIRAAMSAA